MRAKLPWILLAGSVLLNVFFAAGVIYSKMTVEHLREAPSARLDYLADELDLDRGEREALQELRRTVGERRAAMREETGPLRQALVEQMAEPGFDRARFEALMAARSERFVSYMSDVLEDTHGFLAGLPPEKRQAFLAKMGEERRFLWRLLGGPRREDKDRD